MQVNISGQHISIGSSLQEYAKSRISDVINKYFDHATNVHIHFSKQSFEFICDIIVNSGTGRNIIIKSNATCDDVYSSLDLSISKLEKQLRKYKSKLQDRGNKIKSSEINTEAIKYVISPYITTYNEKEEKIPEFDNPLIVSEKPIEIMKLSVSEAVMQMDLQNLPALMFENIKTGKINIVYYRKDGNISWVDYK